MNSMYFVRIEAIRMENFKSVSKGEVYFNEQKSLIRGEIKDDEFSSILGIYGQNGSGKTTIIECLKIIQQLFSMKFLSNNLINCFRYDEDNIKLETDFYLFNDNEKFYFTYQIIFKKEESKIFIDEEKLSYFDLLKKKKTINIYQYKNKQINKSFLNLFTKEEQAIINYLIAESNYLDLNNDRLYSTLFNPKLFKIFKNNKGFADFFKFIDTFYNFANTKLFIYPISYFASDELGGIRYKINDSEYQTLNFNETSISNNYFDSLEHSINQINKVLPHIIPNLEIVILKTNSEQESKYLNTTNFVLMSKKEDKLTLLNNESNGIKKIISILNGIIEVFNHEGYFLAIDELDSGLYEYLLGELIYSFENFSSGQLLFTSHNLRALEKMNYKNVFFTTVSPNKRFTKLSNIRETNNLRDVYYKKILNAPKEDIKLYDNIRSDKLIKSLLLNEDKNE